MKNKMSEKELLELAEKIKNNKTRKALIDFIKGVFGNNSKKNDENIYKSLYEVKDTYFPSISLEFLENISN